MNGFMLKEGDIVLIGIVGKPQRRCWTFRGKVLPSMSGILVAIPDVKYPLEFDTHGNLVGGRHVAKYYIVRSLTVGSEDCVVGPG